MASRLTAVFVASLVTVTIAAGLGVGAQHDDQNGPVDLIIHNVVVYAAGSASRGGSLQAPVARGFSPVSTQAVAVRGQPHSACRIGP